MLSILFCIIAGQKLEASWTFLTEAQFNLAHRSYSSKEFTEEYLEASTGSLYESRFFSFEARGQIRSLQSKSNELNTNDPQRINLKPPSRLFDFSSKLSSNENNQTYFDLSSFWITLNSNSFSFAAGRKPLGIGLLKVLPIWNRTSASTPSLSGYNFINTQDIAEFRWSSQMVAMSLFGVFGRNPSDDMYSLEMIHFGKVLESHVLIGQWWEQNLIGYSGALDIFGGTWKIESLIIQKSTTAKAGNQLGFGFEKALSEKWSVLAEFLHSSFGEVDSNLYYVSSPSRFQTFVGRNYLFPQISLQATSFTKVALATLVNLNDKSFLANLQSSYSLSDNFDLTGEVKWPLGPEKTEFGIKNSPAQYARWIGLGLKLAL